MTIALVLMVTGLIAVLYAVLAYRNADQRLADIKKEDLVSYYIDLALQLLPVPFWAFIIGALAFIIGLITVIIYIVLTF